MDDKSATMAAAKKFGKELEKLSKTELVSKQYKLWGSLRFDLDAAGIADMAVAMAENDENATVSSPLDRTAKLSDTDVTRILKELGESTAGVSMYDLRQTLNKVLIAAGEEGYKTGQKFYVKDPDFTDAQRKDVTAALQIIQSDLATGPKQRADCDAYSVYNPYEAQYNPQGVKTKMLQCNNDTYGQCRAKPGENHPFTCAPTFEECMSGAQGNHGACQLVASQMETGEYEQLKKLNAALKINVTFKGNEKEMINAMRDVWVKKYDNGSQNGLAEYTMLIMATMLDKEAFEMLRKEHNGGRSVDAIATAMASKVWERVQVPIIRMVREGNTNPAKLHQMVKQLGILDMYEELGKAQDATLHSLMLELSKSTELMRDWLALSGYVEDSQVKLDAWHARAFMLGLHMIKYVLFGPQPSIKATIRITE